MNNELKIINQAREYLRGDIAYNDINLVVYMVRDLQSTKDAGLSNLAWAMYRDNNAIKSEAVYLLDRIEKYIKEN